MNYMVCYDGLEMAKTALKLAQIHDKVWNATVEVLKVVSRSESMKHTKVSKMEWEL